MRVDAYLDRIGYEGSKAPTADTLRRLHRAHMMAVPFENLDIHLRVPIVLSVPAFYEKIVARRRGGFCYELNGLFAWLLTELGYRVELLSARVMSAGRLSPEFDHMLILVACEGRWIADVGFGDSTLTPLRAEPAFEAEGDGYSVVQKQGAWTMQRRRGEVVEPQYVFTLNPHRLDEFEPRCLYQQTSPESHFTQNTICSLATPGGRVTLSGGRLIVTTGELREERQVSSAETYRSMLKSEFGIELGRAEVDRLAAGFSLL
jgi:N-hydroxyarylamine O-acetyltransferase